MPGITLDLSDAAELAEMLTFLADWLSGSQKQTLADSLDRLRRPPRLHHRHPLRRPAPVRLPPRRQRRRRPLRRADIMINKTRLAHRTLDKITRITPNLRGRWPRSCGCSRAQIVLIRARGEPPGGHRVGRLGCGLLQWPGLGCRPSKPEGGNGLVG